MIYGREDSDPKLKSVQEWCENVLKDGWWCSDLFIQLVASMWAVRITLVRSDSCSVIKFRHDKKKLYNSDMCLVFNCHPIFGHYSAATYVDETGLQTRITGGRPLMSEGYDKKKDLKERFIAHQPLWNLEEDPDKDDLLKLEKNLKDSEKKTLKDVSTDAETAKRYRLLN